MYIYTLIDDRLIMKQLSRAEADALLRFAPSYFEYMSRAFFKEASLLVYLLDHNLTIISFFSIVLVGDGYG
jgi:hypothetical protein